MKIFLTFLILSIPITTTAIKKDVYSQIKEKQQKKTLSQLQSPKRELLILPYLKKAKLMIN